MSRLKRDLILSAIDVTREKRDAAISALIKVETKLRELQKQLYRHDKREAKLAALNRTAMLPNTWPVPVAYDPAPNVTAAAMRDAPPPPSDDLSIPDFLKRDAVTRMTIEAANAERKRTKAQVRIEKLKAKQSGETRKVPLTGKDALRFIREGK